MIGLIPDPAKGRLSSRGIVSFGFKRTEQK